MLYLVHLMYTRAAAAAPLSLAHSTLVHVYPRHDFFLQQDTVSLSPPLSYPRFPRSFSVSLHFSPSPGPCWDESRPNNLCHIEGSGILGGARWQSCWAAISCAAKSICFRSSRSRTNLGIRIWASSDSLRCSRSAPLVGTSAIISCRTPVYQIQPCLWSARSPGSRCRR